MWTRRSPHCDARTTHPVADPRSRSRALGYRNTRSRGTSAPAARRGVRRSQDRGVRVPLPSVDCCRRDQIAWPTRSASCSGLPSGLLGARNLTRDERGQGNRTPTHQLNVSADCGWNKLIGSDPCSSLWALSQPRYGTVVLDACLTNRSITTMFPIAFSSETGTEPTPRTASENRSACNVY